MKTNYKYAAIAILSLGLGFASCEKSDLRPSVPEAREISEPGRESEKLNQILGRWKLYKFNENGVDLTAQYYGAEFDFGIQNRMAIVRNGQRRDGRWTQGNPQSNNTRNKLFIDMGEQGMVSAFSDTWQIISLTPEKLELKTSYDNKVDYLTLVK